MLIDGKDDSSGGGFPLLKRHVKGVWLRRYSLRISHCCCCQIDSGNNNIKMVVYCINERYNDSGSIMEVMNPLCVTEGAFMK